MINELQNTLSEQNIEFTVSQEAKDKLAELGYNPLFGARPLRRVIQEQLEDKIADFILDEPNVKKMAAVLKDGELELIADKVTV